MRILTHAVLLATLTGCFGPQPSIIEGPEKSTVEIAAHRLPCFMGEPYGLCPIQDSRLTDVWIEGFSHEWGHTYTLEIESWTDPGEPPADGTNHHKRLLRVIRDELVSDRTEFKMRVYGIGKGSRPFVEVTGATQGEFMDDQPFTCKTESICADLRSLLDREHFRADLTFEFVVDTEVDILLKSVEEL